MTAISSSDQVTLQQHHEYFNKKARIASITTAAAALLIIFSSIVITCASLCAVLPNVNVIQSIILPGILPGACGILLSIPFIILSVKFAREKKARRKEWVESFQTMLTTYKVEGKEKEAQMEFVKKNFFPKKTSREYRQKIVDDLRALYPKDKASQSPAQQTFVEALDDVKKDLFPHKKKKD